MASFAIILVVCGALCSIGGMHFGPADALVTHEESSPFPPLPPTRRYGPPEFVNRDSSSNRAPTEHRLQDWEPGTPPRKPPKRPPTKPGLGTAEEPMVPDSNPIPVPDSDLGTAEEPMVPDLNPIPVPDSDLGTAEEPMVPNSNPIPVPSTTVAKEPAFPKSDPVTPPKKPGLQDLRLIPVPITGGGPSAYP